MIPGTFRACAAWCLRTLVLLGVFVGVYMLAAPTSNVSAATGINQQMNFQGRLLNAQGAVVPDGFYNVQFKIYQDGSGTTAGNPGGSLKWTENYLGINGQAVQVKNGFISVQLGSIASLSSIDWTQDTLWLSMNIGSTSPSCTPFSACGGDGEMVPMKRLSTSPYAMSAGSLEGKKAADFIQNSTSPQTANFNISGNGVLGGNLNVSGTATAGTSLLTPLVDTATATPLSIGSTTATSITIGRANGLASLTLSSSSMMLGMATNPTTMQAATQTLVNTAGSSLTIQGATGNGSGNGGAVVIQGGNSGTSGQYGGNLSLSGGTGTTANGLVILGTPTFSTTTSDANCFTNGTLVTDSCIIAQSSINNSASVIVGLSLIGKSVTMPAPTITTAGRVVYITAANGSKDFTLSVNGGGLGNQISMRQNTTATMIWSGSSWTAAGASSSTTLQAAYDNTLQTPGGAELIVSKTSATNGLTIRDSSYNPVNGTLLSVQTSSAAGLLSVNGNVTEYTTNSGAEQTGGTETTFPTSTWSGIGGATVSRYSTAGNFIATGQGSVQVQTTATAGSGVKNQLNSALIAKTNYNVSFTTRLASGTFTDLEVFYSVDGTAATTQCTNAKVVPTSVWSKVNCTFTAPATGILASNAILIRQASGGTAKTYYVDNISVTIAADYNYAADGKVNDATNFTSNWTSVGAATVSRTTSAGNDESDSAQVITTGANQGIRNKLAVSPLVNTLYRVTAYAASTTSGFNSLKISYSRNGGTAFADCADYNTQTISSSTSAFTKVTCYISTDATAPSAPYVYITQTDATGRTFFVDTLSMTLSTAATPNVQVGGGVNGGPTTLFTLDKGASAPIAGDNESLLGSMYYDTTLGKLQCYEARGWGACGSSPDTIVTLSPEYTNAVLHGTGIGTMTSDLCSDSLKINNGFASQPTICGSKETYNFYKWTSPQASQQTYSIYVTYQLPTTFKNFASGQTSLMGRTDNGSSGGNATVQYSIYKDTGALNSGLVPCDPSTTDPSKGIPVQVSTGTSTSWANKTASSKSDPSTCAFSPGQSIVFQIEMLANKNANAYVGNLNFTFNNR